MPIFRRDGIAFDFIDRGVGRPFLFQHGLSADASQPSELVGQLNGVRVIALTCRYHGTMELAGDPARLSIPAFADDVEALARHLRLGRLICGGISMGAAVAVSLAVHAPDLVAALVLVRPAWLDAASPPHLAIYRLAARHLRRA